MPRSLHRVLFALALLPALDARPAAAHGAYHELIDRANQRIAQDPGAESYVNRGELYRAHGDFDLALADFTKAGTSDPKLAAVELMKGRTLLEAGRALAARPLLERYAEQHPEDPRAFLFRARVRVAMGRHRDAAADYATAFSRMQSVSPDELNERLRAQTEAGMYVEALRDLDLAMKKVGVVVTLQLPAIDLELRAKRWDQALARLETLAAQSPRKESWLLRRGRILAQAGRKPEARAVFAEARKALEALPPHLRNVPAMGQLESEIKDAELALEGKGKGTTRAKGKAEKAAGRAGPGQASKPAAKG
jgi:predicted Zn-dependent protease